MNWKFWSPKRRKSGAAFPGSVLSVVYSQGDDGYIIAECPQLPGCMSQGRNREEASRNIRDAIQSVLMVRLGQFVTEGERCNCRPVPASLKEEKIRVKGPELISV